MSALTIFFVWLLGALMGSLATAVYLWWQLATGKRTVRPWEGR